MRFRSALWFLPVLGIVAGCGGGGSSPIAGGGGQVFGPLVTRSTGNPGEPMLISGRNVLLTGIAGASFSSVAMSLPPATQVDADALLRMSPLTYSRSGRAYLFDLSNYLSIPLTLAGPTYSNPVPVSFSPQMDRFVSSEVALDGRFQVFIANLDGTGRRQLSPAGNDATRPRFSPLNNQVAFLRVDSGVVRLFTISPAGGTAVAISPTTTSVRAFAYSPAGDRVIAVERTTGSSTDRIVSYPAAGGTGTVLMNVWNSTLINSIAVNPRTEEPYFAQGNVVYYLNALGASYSVWSGGSADYVMVGGVSADGRYASILHFPDGSGNAVLKTVDVATREENARLTMDTWGAGEPGWAPYVRNRNLIGTGGVLGTGSAGFVYGMSGRAVTSVVTFDSPVRSTVTLTKQDDTLSNQPNVGVVIDAPGGLSSLSYINGVSLPPVRAVTGGTSTGAVVVWSSTDGGVAAVLPYTRGRSGGAPKLRYEGQSLVVEGPLDAVIDPSGKRMAEAGLSRVSIGPKGEIQPR